MKKRHLIFQLLLCFMFLSTIANAQQAYRDTAFVNESISFARKAHTTKTQKQSPLYNGGQYAVYNPVEEEHPYFLSDDWIDGSIVYSGEQFDGIPLMYDLSSDKLIAEHFTGAAIELITAKVSAFSIGDHNFRKYQKNDDVKQSIPEGFYEVLYDGKVKILKRRVKTYTEIINMNEIMREFEEKTHYYVVKNNAFYSIGSRGALMNILSEKKRELRKFSRDNRLGVRKDDTVFIKLAAYYDTLIP